MKEKLIDILENEKADELIPFLQSLTLKDKKALSTTIKSKAKELIEDVQKPDIGWTSVGTENQITLLSVVIFVCLGITDFTKLTTHRWAPKSNIINVRKENKPYWEKFNIETILKWYCPDWFTKYVNNDTDIPHGRPTEYERVMQWYDKGYVTSISPELVVNYLPGYVVWWDDKDRYEAEKLYNYSLTLEKHIWLLFQRQSLLASSSYSYSKYWPLILKKIADDNKINRIHLLRELLFTANNSEMNKPLINWFVDVFNILTPTDDELLHIQDELLIVLNSPQSKPVSNALKLLTKICSSEDFKLDNFISILPLNITSSIKAIVVGCIEISELLLKTKSKCSNEICTILCSGFISKDESVQKKLAKVLIKYANGVYLSDILQGYRENILESVKPLLENMMVATNLKCIVQEDVVSMPMKKRILIREDNKIAEIDNFDDFLFFINQAFNNNEVYHCFVLPEYISKFDNYITTDNVSQLGLACKQAKLCIGSFSRFNRLYAAFFLSYIKYLHTKYPNETVEMVDGIGTWYFDLGTWKEKACSTGQYPYYHILKKSIEEIKEGKEVCLLSTPTHLPLWINPVNLVERIKEYQSKGVEPDSMDLQMAIQRTALDNTDEALIMAKEQLKNSELRDLIIYLLDKEAMLPDRAEYPAWWITASFTKNPYTIPASSKIWEQFNHKLSEYNIIGDYTWKIGKDEYDTTRFEIDLSDSVFEGIENIDENVLFEYTYKRKHYKKYDYDMIYGNDIQRDIYSNPYSHASVLVEYISCIENFSAFTTNDKKGFMGVMTALYELELPFVHADYLLLTWAMMGPDKVSRDFAGELWVKATSLQMIDNAKLGIYIQQFVATNKFPIKRFTDLLDNRLMEFEIGYQKELIRLIDSLFIHQKNPIENSKKLFEIYLQLLSISKEKVDNQIVSLLEEWQHIASLKKIIKQILEK